jgi:hypothetical protein
VPTQYQGRVNEVNTAPVITQILQGSKHGDHGQ